MHRSHLRYFLYRPITFLVLLALVVFWSACGGTSASSSPGSSNSSGNSSGSNNPPGSSSQPGAGSSGSGGSSGSAGSGAGSTGSSGGTGSGTSTPGGGAAYLYVAVDNGNQAALRGYKVDATGATLAEVAGSPFIEQGGSSGVVAATKNFLYSASLSSGNSVITGFRSDASSGSLSNVGVFQAGGPTQAALFTEPSGHNLYVDDNLGDILTYNINPDGTLTNTGQSLHLAEGVSAFAVSPNGRLAYAVIFNGSAKTGTLTDALVAIDRDPNSGALSNSRQVGSNQHLFDLQFDTSGRYLLAACGSSTDICVFSVDPSGNVTAVPGSPFAATKGMQNNSQDFIRTIRIDPSSRFVYALDANGADPKPEYIAVFSFNDATGTLAPVQNWDMNPGTNPVSLDVDQSVVIAVNTNSGFNPSNIDVFRRDAGTGMLSSGGSPVTVPTALGQSAEVHF